MGSIVEDRWSATHKYGMRFYEFAKSIKPKPPMTLPQARLHGLKQEVERSRQRLRTERDRQRQQREAERRRKEQQRQRASF